MRTETKLSKDTMLDNIKKVCMEIVKNARLYLKDIDLGWDGRWLEIYKRWFSIKEIISIYGDINDKTVDIIGGSQYKHLMQYIGSEIEKKCGYAVKLTIWN